MSAESVASLLSHVQSLYPLLDTSRLIGGYSGLRPASQHQDYSITFDLGRGWVRVAGIRSTGLTSSLAIAQYVASTIIKDYSPTSIPTMPEPEVETDGRVRIGDKVYTPTHPLTRLGLLRDDLPQVSLRSTM